MDASRQELESRLTRIDGRGYPAYKDIRGHYAFDGFELIVDHVQGDPFAAPSRLRVRVPIGKAGFPPDALTSAVRRVALRDYLARQFSDACRAHGESLGSGKSGLLGMDRPGQEILERSSVQLSGDAVEARFQAGLPARGRRVMGRQAIRLLCEIVPRVVGESLLYERLDGAEVRAHLDAAEDGTALRESLGALGLVAFVADGAVLPRRSGVDDRPMAGDGVVPFRSPESLRVSVNLPHAGSVSGMGIPVGVTLIVGGGYHGKSTLLQALERGVYNHVPGDGRERVATDFSAVKIRAEDGRPVAGVDIRPFIDHLPGGGNPSAFRTRNASGSTSQAANIVEALEVGASLLLLDEDTCATNLMIRDARMQELVEKAGEPITPFLDRVRELADKMSVSSILVLGGSGDYFDVADRVVRMDAFVPCDVSREAAAIATEHPTRRRAENEGPWPAAAAPRRPDPSSFDPRKGRRDVSIKAHALRAVQYGVEEIDLTYLAQLVEEGQVRAIGKALEMIREELERNGEELASAVRAVMAAVSAGGLDALDSRCTGDYVEFRAHELAAAVNRLRSLRMH